MKIDSAQKPAGQWIDCPGDKTGIKRWTASTRYLAEFVLGAEDSGTSPRKMQDDAGGIYYVSIRDVSPKWFRVRLSDAIKLTPAQWKGVRGLPNNTSPILPNVPYRTEASAGLSFGPLTATGSTGPLRTTSSSREPQPHRGRRAARAHCG